MNQTVQTFGPDQLDRFRHDPSLPQLIDCRSAGEFAAGHVPGSLNIPVEELPSRLHDIDPSRPVVFICASGRRARVAADLVAGGTPVSVLDGGVNAWKGSGREVIVNAPSTWAIERQVRLIAGSFAALGGIGAFFNPAWAALPVFIGLGLTFAAVTNTCAMGEVLMQMPWNRRRT
jgi:rhodanese-related sulfurtransferase